MKLDNKCKLEKLTATGHGAALEYMSLQKVGETHKLISCNGYALAVIDVEADDSEVGFVTVDAIVQARKLAKRGDIDIALNGTIDLANGAKLPRPTLDSVSEYPDWQKVTPTKATTVTLGINAKMLYDLAQALGSDIVNIELTDDKVQLGPMFVRPSIIRGAQCTDRFGVIVPRRG